MDKEVDFNRFCPICKYNSTPESLDPCNDCLNCPYRRNSKIPMNFKLMDVENDKQFNTNLNLIYKILDRHNYDCRLTDTCMEIYNSKHVIYRIPLYKVIELGDIARIEEEIEFIETAYNQYNAKEM